MIKSFNEIPNVSNALIICDFDETILHFPCGLGKRQWWRKTFDTYFKEHLDYERADEEALAEWTLHAQTAPYEHTDEDGLRQLFQRASLHKNTIICVTARSEAMAKTTERQCETLGIKFDHIFYTSTRSKGSVILELLDVLPKHEMIVFVDDLQRNIDDVKSALASYAHACYLFNSH